MLSKLHKIHNDETLYKLFHNNKVTEIIIKRNITFKNHYNNLILKKYLDANRGYFKYNPHGFNSLLINFKVDLIFVNRENIVIDLYENFAKNKFSNYYPDAKFYYVLSIETIKRKKIQIGDKLEHQRLSKKETIKFNKINQSFS